MIEQEVNQTPAPEPEQDPRNVPTVLDDEVFDEPPPVAAPIKEEEKVERKPHRAKLDDPYSIPAEVNQSEETISLPSNLDFETRAKLESTPNINLMDNPAARKWGEAIKDGLEFNTFAEGFVPTLEDQEASFRQGVEFNGQRYSAQAPKIKDSTNENLKGERAVLRVMRDMGLGTTFQVPLWHTGIWVTLKPPAESEIIELNRRLVAEKIRLGRYTYGLAYSNTTSYTNSLLLDFIFAHTYTTTVRNEELPISKLKDVISTQDLFTLIWGFACTMYPRGFQYRRPCINDPEKCNHVTEEKLNLSKLQWTNTNALTEWQKSHMTTRQPYGRDMGSVKRYKEELLRTKPRRLTLTEPTDAYQIHVTLKTPVLSEYITEGEKWITGLVNKVNEALTTSDTDQERNAIIHRYAQASSMRQYAHWVESIELGTNIIDDVGTINSALDTISADDRIRPKFINEVVNYINDSTISLIGIPVYDCPACGMDQKVEGIGKDFVNIIPLDVIQLFFALITQRIQRIADR